MLIECSNVDTWVLSDDMHASLRGGVRAYLVPDMHVQSAGLLVRCNIVVPAEKHIHNVEIA